MSINRNHNANRNHKSQKAQIENHNTNENHESQTKGNPMQRTEFRDGKNILKIELKTCKNLI